MKFWIYTWNFNYHAGVKALHRLQHVLISLGHEAIVVNPNEQEKPIGYIEKEDIVIYPEVISGNPLKAVRIVHWLLNKPGVFNHVEPYSTNDYLTAWNKEHTNLSEGRRLCVNIWNGFENRNQERISCAFWRGKTKETPAGFHDRYPGLVEITPTTPASKSLLIALLNRIETLFTFDSMSALNTEAHICGCKVVHVFTTGHEEEIVPTDDFAVLEKETVKKFIEDMETFWK